MIKSKLKKAKGLIGKLFLGTSLVLSPLLVNRVCAEEEGEEGLYFLKRLGFSLMGAGVYDGIADSVGEAGVIRALGTFMGETEKEQKYDKLYKERNEAIRKSGMPLSSETCPETMPILYACNYYRDFNGDKAFEYPTDFVGIKNIFRNGEGLVLILRENIRKHVGKNISLEILTPKGESFWNYSYVLEKKGGFKHFGKGTDLIGSLLETGGFGIYTVPLYVNEKFAGMYKFEIIEGGKPLEIKNKIEKSTNTQSSDNNPNK